MMDAFDIVTKTSARRNWNGGIKLHILTGATADPTIKPIPRLGRLLSQGCIYVPGTKRFIFH